ncbi:MAG: 3-deoxy-manno-octulosonate cytidylyltransferase [Ignavibacteriaceae bacterium]|nr:3-deoxy-manno-octulosonate cytidylyltransferase [Ignavibacteriaceae bacterium]
MIYGIIPARYASTRLPGKPLAMIGDKPLIQHTYESAKKSKLINELIIATDHEEILHTAASFGARVVFTPDDIETGSDRIAFVARTLKDAEIIVNIQGDEPFIKGEMIDQAVAPLLFEPEIDVATLMKRITDINELKSPAVVKVTFDNYNYALYFSRSPIPYVRDAQNENEWLKAELIYKHIGLYVYKYDALMQFTSLQQGELEKTEKLEQLRMLENRMRIKVVETDLESFSVDTPDDLRRATEIYKSQRK